MKLSSKYLVETLQAKWKHYNIFEVLKGKPYNREHSNWQSYHSNLKERENFTHKKINCVHHH